jgi:hypothetical protein
MLPGWAAITPERQRLALYVGRRENHPAVDLLGDETELDPSHIQIPEIVDQIAPWIVQTPNCRHKRTTPPTASWSVCTIQPPISRAATTCRWLQKFIREFIENFSLNIAILSCSTRSIRFASELS